MLPWLWLTLAFPFAGFVVLALAGSMLSKRAIATIALLAVGLAAVVALALTASFFAAPPPHVRYEQVLWHWLAVGQLEVSLGLRLDPLSVVMVVVVAVVALLIFVYATASMFEEAGYARFFAYMNLFVASMLTLVLADDLLLLYLGWEGVGLCSYLLIGFWHEEAANGRAAQKAFIVTRIGDVALALALLILFTQLGTLDLAALNERAPQLAAAHPGLTLAVALLLLGGAVGKSAQLPLQTWLPDAMAGPTPVSALIHAATMVTAGVYLIARLHPFFLLAPAAHLTVAALGATTLLLAAVSALFQRDIKRVLAYSTMSQVGYMFLALGVGAWAAALLHFVTHAFFKSLLFLSAGVVIDALGHEHDIHRMGGLRRELPTAFWTFLVGSSALAGLPIITAGFYSKDWILDQAFIAGPGGPWLWLSGLVGALLTSVYIFRVVFLVFFGPRRSAPRRQARLLWPLGVLAGLSLVGGLVEVPRTLGRLQVFARALGPALPHSPELGLALMGRLELLAALAALGGVGIAWVLFARPVAARHPISHRLARFWAAGWGFDALYDVLLVRPYRWLARVDRGDLFEAPYRGLVLVLRGFHQVLRRVQNGHLRWYATALAGGTVVIVAIVLFV